MARLVDGPRLTEAIKEFQGVAGLAQTGEADEQTLEMMHKPRCGVSDNGLNTRRSKRFALLGAKWKRTYLTYRIVTYSRQMSRTATDYWVKEAFKVWMTVTPLQFYKIYSYKADIEIMFKGYHHGDPYEFDGKGGTLAHAFAPGEDIAGDAHFDDSENWIIRNPNIGGTDLFSVAVHEFGHVLGLSHYYTSGAVMRPFYTYVRDVNIVLNYDDINAIQTLYGANERRPTPVPRVEYTLTPRPTTTMAPSTTPKHQVPEFCRREVHFDAIVSTKSGKTYAFEGWQYVYVWNGVDLDPTTPKFTSDVFSQLHWGVDTAFSIKWRSREIIYIIKSWFAWIYDVASMRLMAAQVPLGKMFPDLPIYLDASFEWQHDGNIYIFKGAQYWRMAQVRQDVFKADPGYPRPMADWNLPIGRAISAAMSWPTNRRTYFFSEENYYKYDDNVHKVDSGYPRPMAVWWLGCPDAPKELNMGRWPDAQEAVSGAVSTDTTLLIILVFTTAAIVVNL